ncbi:MAG: DEAD/DEAH box helicase family protein, partial [Ignisphaera sp.]|nr:DEAD/DEAH box helicase family protein [Ignisphaera sp.]
IRYIIMRATPFDKYWVQLEFASNEERIKLEKAVSYTVPGSSFNPSFNAGFWNGTKSFLTEGNKLPAGIFKSIFPDHVIARDYNHTDLKYENIPLYRDNPQYERRDYQLEAINTILHHKRMIVAAVVGSGKTLIAAATISYLLEKDKKTKVLFVCYDKNILAQSIKNFKKYGFNVSQYGDGVKDLTGDVVVATVQSLTRIEKPRKVLAPFTACFCDESHHSKSKTSKAVLTRLVNCDYYIGLTGTPFKDKTLELAELMAVLGPVMFQYGFERAVNDKNIAPVKCIFYKLPYDEEAKTQVIDRKNYKHIWDKAIKDSKVRNKAIANILKYTTDLLAAPAIIMVDRVEHGNTIGNEVRNNTKVNCLEMYGEDSVIVRDMKKASLMTDEINLLISSVLNEGVDLAISPVIAVNASGRKNFINMIQFLGRIVRSNTKFGDFRVYLDFIDTAHPMLKKHSLERIQNCKDTGSEVVL